MKTIHARITLSYFKQEQRVLRLKKIQRYFEREVMKYEEDFPSIHITLLRARIRLLLLRKKITDHNVNVISIDIARFLRLMEEEEIKKRSTVTKKIFRLILSLFGTSIMKTKDEK